MSIRPPARFLAALACVVAALSTVAVPAVADEGDVRLLVTYEDRVDAATAADGLPVAGSFSTASAPVGPATAGDDSAVQVLTFAAAADAAAAEQLLARRDDVRTVERDTRLYAADVPTATATDVPTAATQTTATAAPGDVTPASTTMAAGTATAARSGFDTGVGSWGVRNLGQLIASRAGRANIDVGATQAWPHATGKGVVVAVIDTGVDVSHPLLQDQLWDNPKATTPRTDPVTGRTYVGDAHGWNFISTPANRNGTNQLYAHADLDAHGTHVAGIIAGARDEVAGFSGVAPDAQLMVLKFLDGESGWVSDAVAAIRYAAANGAHVINASWTSPVASPALQVALAESGLPVVTAAGNTARTLEDQPVYPVAWRLPNVVGVAAIDHTGALASYSARSRDLVDVVAPGSQILSTVPGARLERMSGTSQAAPHVTGALALALQHHRDHDAATLTRMVRASVRPLAGLRETRSGGLVRAPLLLDRLGTRVPACPSAPAPAFPDVRAGTAHAPAVGCLVQFGITAGRTDGTYGATDGLTRGQVASMVARTLERVGRLPMAPEVGRFADVPATGYVHRDAVEALASIGVVKGRTDTRFDPNATTTRAEFAAIVARTNEYVAGGPYRLWGPRFPDAVGHIDEAPVRTAAGLGVVYGLSDGRFAPDTHVRRDQAASMLGRLLDRLVQEGLLEPAA